MVSLLKSLISIGAANRDAAADARAPHTTRQGDPVDVARRLRASVAEAMTRNVTQAAPLLFRLLSLEHRAGRLFLRLAIGHLRDHRSRGPLALHAALKLAGALGDAYAHCLIRTLRDRQDPRWPEHALAAMAGMLDHRHDELTLRLCSYEQWVRTRWRALHGVFKLARTHALDRKPPGHGSADASRSSTVEQRYIALLLLHYLDSDHFVPRDILRARAWLERWSSHLTLAEHDSAHSRGNGTPVVFVDLDGSEGLKPQASRASASTLALDLSRLAAIIDQDRKALRAETGETGHDPPPSRRRRETLLDRLEASLLRDCGRDRRRAAREQVNAKAEVVFGYAAILEAVGSGASAGHRRAAAPADGTSFERHSLLAATTGIGGDGASNDDIAFDRWFVKDRSAAGTKLRGHPSGAAPILPGMLVAFRYAHDLPWIVAFIRRLRRITPTHFEIGVEHIGHGARRVVLARAACAGNALSAQPEACAARFAAIALHAGAATRTLLVPAQEHFTGRIVELRSRHHEYTLRFGDPTERRAEFVWTRFDLVAKRVRAESAALPIPGDPKDRDRHRAHAGPRTISQTT